MVFESMAGQWAFPLGTTWNAKAYCLTANGVKEGNMVAILLPGAICVAQRGRYTGPDGRAEQHFEVQTSGKTNTLTTVQKDNLVAQPVLLAPLPIEFSSDCSISAPCGKKLNLYQVMNGKIELNGKKSWINLPDGFYIIRPLTVTECCRLQTLPDDYCRMAKKTHAYRGLGNGWTAEVIIHILSHALAGIPKDEEIVVLSMYDGIGTGRYCFDKLGYRNIRYFAYEIEKSAMEIASTNFPDIVQCGDAFQVRETGWGLPL